MTPLRPIRDPVLLAGAVLLAALATEWMQAPSLLRVLLPAVAALALGLLLSGIAGAGRREAGAALARTRTAEAEAERLAKAAAQMRHDLRGILSPALLTADRLAMSQDPAARRAGEAMISTVERAEQRLRND